MKTRPILFSGPMVRALLEGRKTQTRRVAKEQPPNGVHRCRHSSSGWSQPDDHDQCYGVDIKCPYGEIGDLLWVRETWRTVLDTYGCGYEPGYRETCSGVHLYQWRPSIFMPRKYSRLTLRISDIRLESLWDISADDAKAEGVTGDGQDAREAFRLLWRDINGIPSWNSKPWVWVLQFSVIRVNVDQVFKEAA